MNIHVSHDAISDDKVRYFYKAWLTLTQAAQRNAIAPHEFAPIFTQARAYRKKFSSKKRRPAINNIIHQTQSTWDTALTAAIPQMSPAHIIELLDHLYNFGLTLSAPAFLAIESRIQHTYARTSNTDLAAIAQQMAQHCWRPTDDFFEILSKRLNTKSLLNNAAKLQKLAHTNAQFNAISNTQTPLNPLISHGLTTMLEAQTDPTKRQFFARSNMHAAWSQQIHDLTKHINFDPFFIKDTVSTSETSLIHYLSHHFQIADKHFLGKIGRYADITIPLNGQTVHLELDGEHHFISTQSHFYNGRTLLMSTATANAYPNDVFIHIPYYEAKHFITFAAKLASFLKSVKSPLPTGTPLILLQSANTHTLTPLKSSPRYVRRPQYTPRT